MGSIPNQFPELRLHLSVSLYYKLLGAIIHDEESKNVDFGQLQACAYQTLSTSQFISLCVSPLQTMLEYEMLHKSLFALSVEIVLFSYNSQSRSVTYPLISLAHCINTLLPSMSSVNITHMSPLETKTLE